MSKIIQIQITIATEAVILNQDGYRVSENVMVLRINDRIIVGNSTYLADDFEFLPDRLRHWAGWEVLL